MYLYVFKNEKFIDRVFVNSNDQIDETANEIHDKNGDVDVLICDVYYDVPAYYDLLKQQGKLLNKIAEEQLV